MAIRKYGTATGRVTEVDQAALPGKTAAQDAQGWDEADDRALADENKAADREDD